MATIKYVYELINNIRLALQICNYLNSDVILIINIICVITETP